MTELTEKAYQACEWLNCLLQDGASVVQEIRIDAGNAVRRFILVEEAERDQIRALRDEFIRLEQESRPRPKAEPVASKAQTKPVQVIPEKHKPLSKTPAKTTPKPRRPAKK